MSSGTCLFLRRVFFFIGCLTIVLSLFVFLLTVVGIVENQSRYGGPLGYRFIYGFLQVISNMGRASLAFLLSSVFLLFYKRELFNPNNGKIFMGITVAGFILEGFLGSISWIIGIIDTFKHLQKDGVYGILNMIVTFMSILPNFISFVYAAAVYVLYKNFINIVLSQEAKTEVTEDFQA